MKKIIKKEKTEKINSEQENIQEDMNKVESILFASGKYLDTELISTLCEIDKRKLKKILESLKERHDKSNTSLAIFQEGDSWKINVREKYIPLVRKIVSDTELNKSSMETLSVIAWKSPALQSEIVRIRGNKCYDHIDELVEMGFINKEKKGRSYVLKTTEKFYDYFDIDKKNLQGVLETVKVPDVKEEQKTLEVSPLIPETVTNKIEAIEVRKRTETEDEKQAYSAFLTDMEQKLEEVSKKNALLEQDMPSRKPSDITVETTSDLPVVETVSDLPPESVPETPAEEKKKTLTKKQLEKKFKDELQRVKEKMEKK